jgi:hypothetical protein
LATAPDRFTNGGKGVSAKETIRQSTAQNPNTECPNAEGNPEQRSRK